MGNDLERFAPQDAFGSADPAGPTQFVVGSGGASLRAMGEIEPSSLTSAGNVYGVLKLTLHETSYDWQFLPAAGCSYTDAGSASCVVGSARSTSRLRPRSTLRRMARASCPVGQSASAAAPATRKTATSPMPSAGARIATV